MLRPVFLMVVLALAVVLVAPSAARADCSCTYNFGATYCCADWGYTAQTEQCSLNGYQWSCTDRVLSNPYITTKVWAGAGGQYCSWDFIDSWVGATSCSYEEASCSTTTPGVCVWTQKNLSCSIYDRPSTSSCGPGGPL